MADPFPCPKCGDLLPASGQLTAEGETMPVYQCDRCTMVTKFCGEDVETAVTFARRADGSLVNPAEPEQMFRF